MEKVTTAMWEKGIKIQFAEERLRRNSPDRLEEQLKRSTEWQSRSVDPESYRPAIAEIRRGLTQPETLPSDNELQDYRAFLLRERDGKSWQEIGDNLYAHLPKEEARRSMARRAWKRANSQLDKQCKRPWFLTAAGIVPFNTSP